jgi:hypothetical protein
MSGYTFNHAASTFAVEAVPVESKRGDIIDEIDALVDEQMAGGEPRQGYDYGDPTYPKCPHCDRHWHGLAITADIADMYDRGYYDEDYSAAEDCSRVLCHGSEFIGPMPVEHAGIYTDYVQSVRRTNYGNPMRAPGMPPWLTQIIDFAEFTIAEMLASVGGVTVDLWYPGVRPERGDNGDPYGPVIQDGQLATFIGPDGRSFTEVAHVTGPPGDRTTTVVFGEARSPILRSQQMLMRMAPLVGELTGQHYENRRLPMRLEDV